MTRASTPREIDMYFKLGCRETPTRALVAVLERSQAPENSDETLARCLSIITLALSPEDLAIDRGNQSLQEVALALRKIAPHEREAFRHRMETVRPVMVDSLATRLRSGHIDIDVVMALAETLNQDMAVLWMLGINRDHPAAIRFWRSTFAEVPLAEGMLFMGGRTLSVKELETFVKRLEAHGIVSRGNLLRERDRHFGELTTSTGTSQLDRSTLFYLGLSGEAQDVAADLARLWQHASRARCEALLSISKFP